MNIYIPKYIKQTLDYKKGELVTAEDYNNILNLLIAASDYNTDILNAIANNNLTELVINAQNARRADEADSADNSNKLSGATLSRAVTTTLANDDNTVPSSKQVKDYVDSLASTTDNTVSILSTRINANESKNTTQDNRLANIDLINNQYGNRISVLENRANLVDTDITEIRNVNTNQDMLLASHDSRLTNLELENVPEDVVSTLMTKGGYAYVTGCTGGEPIYSSDTVKRSDTALSLLVNSDKIPATNFALKSEVTTLRDSSFIIRGELANPNNVDYTVGELKLLKLGSYELSDTKSTALGTLGNAGTLRLYPCNNGLSLEYEIQTGADAGKLLTLFIPQSTPDSTKVKTLNWYDEQARANNIELDITALQSSRLIASNLISGVDMDLVKSGNNITFNHTGPKIVISPTQPPADPNRKTLWIAL